MVGVATAFGRSGLHEWLLQRISAVFILGYAIYMGILLLVNIPMTYFIWEAIFANLIVKVATVFFMLSLMIHSWIGLWTVTTDYIKFTWLRFTVQMLVNVLILAQLIWVIFILWRH